MKPAATLAGMQRPQAPGVRAGVGAACHPAMKAAGS
jgi:hypothetical protein